MGNCCLSLNSSSTAFRQLSSLSLGMCKSWNTSDSTNSGTSNDSGNSSFGPGRSGSDASFNEGHISPVSNLRIFTYLELKTATTNFQENGLLGGSAFGGVYKGWIDGILVAVTKLNAKSTEGFREWESELTFLGRLSHPNLVKLVGYCWEQKELLLVYEYIANGALETHLFGGSSVPPLTWDMRIKIVIGAAKGLSFLHTAKQVIYKDFKISNILLDEFYNAKLSDIGLAKTRMYAYATPEYLSSGRLYAKNDIYGFGVVLAEILTGLRAFDTNRPGEQFSLVNWVTPYFSDKRKLKKVIDRRLKGKYPYEAALQTASLALKCLALEPQNQPSMEQILEKLMEIKSTS